MGYLGTEIRDGALYVDITPDTLDLYSYSPLCGIPIDYSSCWQSFGEAFLEYATQTCPVDTGYLRDHIGFGADDGGIECWSDAPYSAYQEYGTYKMKAQPYFEAALQVAWEATEADFNARWLFYQEMDSDFAFLLAGCTGGIEQCWQYLQVLATWIEKCSAEGYDTTPLEDAYNDVYAHLLQMEQYQEQINEAQASGTGGGIGAFLAQMLGMILGMLIAQVLTFPFSQIWEGTEKEHHPSH
jgi:hypothetical protein